MQLLAKGSRAVITAQNIDFRQRIVETATRNVEIRNFCG
jgi:hypothetical protein